MNKLVFTVTLNPAVDKTVTVEKLIVGGVNRVQELRIDPGGKGINVARVLNNFGTEVAAFGLIAGHQGRFIQSKLEGEGIKTYFINVPGETRTNLKIVDMASTTTTEINEPGFWVEEKKLYEFTELLLSRLKEASFLVLSGSLPAGVSPAIYKDYIENARKFGIKTFLDANGDALREGIAGKPFGVKPNLLELQELMGQTLDTTEKIVDAGKTLLKEGIALVVISLGKDGAIFLSNQEGFKVTPFPVTPLSTVGAGDTMVAAIVFALLQGKPLIEIARLATTAGTVAAAKSGTQACTLAEVLEKLSLVHVERL
ncbi:1-phosphofructokinase [Carboxydothermus pertinax]|nr:1-phosphofructokinase [Carboxydothermus pertinax]